MVYVELAWWTSVQGVILREKTSDFAQILKLSQLKRHYMPACNFGKGKGDERMVKRFFGKKDAMYARLFKSQAIYR